MKDPIHIMIVEDDEDDVDFLREAFAGKGAETLITVFYDGQQALDRLNAIKSHMLSAGAFPHIILLDLNMPLKDGYEMLRAVKADPALMHIPVLILSGSLNPLEKSLCMAAGCEQYFPKPLLMSQYDDLTNYIVDLVLSDLVPAA